MLKEVSNYILKNDYKRILILGCPGVGKTTFSNKLKSEINLPLFRMDDLFWNPSWKPLEKEKFIQVLSDLVNTDSWVIEGNYADYLDVRLTRTQFVVFIDAPTYVCIWRAFKRALKRIFGDKTSLPEKIRSTNSHVFKLKNIFKLFNKIVSFKKESFPVVIDKISKNKIPLLIINLNDNLIIKRINI